MAFVALGLILGIPAFFLLDGAEVIAKRRTKERIVDAHKEHQLKLERIRREEQYAKDMREIERVQRAADRARWEAEWQAREEEEKRRKEQERLEREARENMRIIREYHTWERDIERARREVEAAEVDLRRVVESEMAKVKRPPLWGNAAEILRGQGWVMESIRALPYESVMKMAHDILYRQKKVELEKKLAKEAAELKRLQQKLRELEERKI